MLPTLKYTILLSFSGVRWVFGNEGLEFAEHELPKQRRGEKFF